VRPDSVPRMRLEKKRRRTTKRVKAATSEAARLERQDRDRAFAEWKRAHAPTTEELDQLKEENRSWTHSKFSKP
jgi:hypothetical protein